MEIIHTNQAPEAIGPYSQAIRVGNVLYSSGQIAINPATGTVEATDIVGQSKQVMKNLEAVLKMLQQTLLHSTPSTQKLWAKINLPAAVSVLQNCQRAFWSK